MPTGFMFPENADHALNNKKVIEFASGVVVTQIAGFDPDFQMELENELFLASIETKIQKLWKWLN